MFELTFDIPKQATRACGEEVDGPRGYNRFQQLSQ
jgi:hypothetical protein